MKISKCSAVLWLVLVGVSLYDVPATAQPTLPLAAEDSFTAVENSPTPIDNLPLKSGDLVRITVIGFPELSSEQVITPNGVVQLPMAGDINVADLFPEDASQRVATRLLPYIRRPQVSLTLVDPSPLRVSVTGEVLIPGPRLLSLNDVGKNNVVRLSEILVASGGVTPEADLRNITIRRRVLGDSAPPQQQNSQVFNVDLWEVIQTGNLSADPTIYDGDEIVVPVAHNSDIERQTLLSSTVAPTRVVVSVAGEVKRPGPVEISPTADVNAAIAAAGGPTPEANTRSISLIRMGRDGQIVREEFGFGAETTTIRNGDLIYVDKSASSTLLDFLGAISGPFRLLLDAAIPNQF